MGGINRGNPDRIDAESDQIIQPLLNAFQIADAIPVHILKGTGIDLIDDPAFPPGNRHANKAFGRSEEHTSELQSLMRISYAVFCLKKKKKITKKNNKTKNNDTL